MNSLLPIRFCLSGVGLLIFTLTCMENTLSGQFPKSTVLRFLRVPQLPPPLHTELENITKMFGPTVSPDYIVVQPRFKQSLFSFLVTFEYCPIINSKLGTCDTFTIPGIGYELPDSTLVETDRDDSQLSVQLLEALYEEKIITTYVWCLAVMKAYLNRWMRLVALGVMVAAWCPLSLEWMGMTLLALMALVVMKIVATVCFVLLGSGMFFFGYFLGLLVNIAAIAGIGVASKATGEAGEYFYH